MRVFTDSEDEERVYVQLTKRQLFVTDRTSTDEKGRPVWHSVTPTDTGERWAPYNFPVITRYLNRVLEQEGFTVGEEWYRESAMKAIWNRFRIRETDFEPQSWVVEGLIPESAITLITGWRGTWKTWLSLALAKAVCQGENFLGRRTEMMRALYLNRDNPRKQFMTRLRALDLDGQEENLGLWPLWGARGEPPKIDADISEYGNIAEKCSPMLMTFDSLQRFHSGDENSTKDMAAIFEKWRRLTTLGATVVVLHNSGREAKSRPRGASAIDDGADMLLGLRAFGSPSSPRGITLSLEIQRDKFGGREGEKLILKPSFRTEGDSGDKISFKMLEDTPTAEDLRQENLTEKILAVLRKHPEGLSGRSIVKKVGGKTARVYAELERFREEAVVATEPGPNGGTIYFPPE